MYIFPYYCNFIFDKSIKLMNFPFIQCITFILFHLIFSFSYLKVCATFNDGFRATTVCPVVGPRASEKALVTAESIIKRLRPHILLFILFIPMF